MRIFQGATARTTTQPSTQEPLTPWPIGMAVRDNVSGNPGASRQPEADRQPAPREYKLEFTSATGTRGLEVGDTIPEVSGKDLDNIKFKLSDYQGKVVMLDFWGDW